MRVARTAGRRSVRGARGRSRIPAMVNSFPRRAAERRGRLALNVAVVTAVVALLGLCPGSLYGQGANNEGDLGACTLKNHIYTCSSAAFQKALASATTVSLDTHNADGMARSALKDLVTKKLGKSVAAPDSPADLVFLLMPIDDSGQVENNSSVQDLGTLRIYSATAEGRPAHLLWAETYSGEHDVPWPIVARGVIAKFEKRFQIK